MAIDYDKLQQDFLKILKSKGITKKDLDAIEVPDVEGLSPGENNAWVYALELTSKSGETFWVGVPYTADKYGDFNLKSNVDRGIPFSLIGSGTPPIKLLTKQGPVVTDSKDPHLKSVLKSKETTHQIESLVQEFLYSGVVPEPILLQEAAEIVSMIRPYVYKLKSKSAIVYWDMLEANTVFLPPNHRLWGGMPTLMVSPVGPTLFICPQFVLMFGIKFGLIPSLKQSDDIRSNIAYQVSTLICHEILHFDMHSFSLDKAQEDVTENVARDVMQRNRRISNIAYDWEINDTLIKLGFTKGLGFDGCVNKIINQMSFNINWDKFLYYITPTVFNVLSTTSAPADQRLKSEFKQRVQLWLNVYNTGYKAKTPTSVILGMKSIMDKLSSGGLDVDKDSKISDEGSREEDYEKAQEEFKKKRAEQEKKMGRPAPYDWELGQIYQHPTQKDTYGVCVEKYCDQNDPQKDEIVVIYDKKLTDIYTELEELTAQGAKQDKIVAKWKDLMTRSAEVLQENGGGKETGCDALDAKSMGIDPNTGLPTP